MIVYDTEVDQGLQLICIMNWLDVVHSSFVCRQSSDVKQRRTWNINNCEVIGSVRYFLLQRSIRLIKWPSCSCTWSVPSSKDKLGGCVFTSVVPTDVLGLAHVGLEEQRWRRRAWQVSQTLTGFGEAGRGSSLSEQLLQKISPQFLQWCWRRTQDANVSGLCLDYSSKL